MIYWLEGKEANLLGLPTTSNPHTFNSWEWSQWVAGWQYENKQK